MLEFPDLFAVRREFDSLFPFPRAEVSRDLFLQMIESYDSMIRLQGEMFPHRPGRSGILIAVKDHGKVLVNQNGLGFPVIGQAFRQGPGDDSGQSVYGLFTGGLMDAYIGDGIPPLIHLVLHIRKISESPQRPKIPAYI